MTRWPEPSCNLSGQRLRARPEARNEGRVSLDFPEHLVNPHQRRVHHLSPGAHCRRRHRVIGAVATLRRGLNGRKILMVAVAIAEKEKLFHPCPLLQTDRVVAEELAGNTDERDVTIQQSHSEPRTN